jgi:DNA mismatch repair protein MSH6
VILISGARNRKVVSDDDDSDVYMPDAKETEEANEEEDDIGSLSAEESEPSPSSAANSPESVVRKSKAKSSLSKFNASSPVSSAPSTPKYTPRGSVGAFGKPADKGERVKKFVETNKDRYSWLFDIRDKEGNRPGSENYDPRTLYIPSSAWKSFTAFEKQYWEVKQNLWDTVLFFQKGKFFELYENDATIGNQQFDLKMTDRTNMRYTSL